jgi:hypothetical protein
MRNCEELHFGIKSQILEYVLNVTEPLLPEPIPTIPFPNVETEVNANSPSALPPGIRETTDGGKRKKRRSTKKRKS